MYQISINDLQDLKQWLAESVLTGPYGENMDKLEDVFNEFFNDQNYID